MSEDKADISPVTEHEHAIPKEVKRFFNPGSIVNPLPDGGYYVETTLKDGNYVSGEQQITMTLGKRIYAPGFYSGNPITEDNFRDFFNRHQITTMTVNGNSFPDQEIPIYFLALPGGMNTDEKDPELSAFMDNMHADEYKRIFLYQLKTADHLAFLMHEQGHCLSGEKYREAVDLMDELRNLRQIRLDSATAEFRKTILEKPSHIDDLPKYSSIPLREQELYLFFLRNEALASQIALREIKKLRQQGLDLFPQDPNLSHLIEAYTYALNTRLSNDEYPGIRDAIEDRLPPIYSLIC